jgi:hypothetical protein
MLREPGSQRQPKVAMWKPDFWTPVRTVARWPVTTQIGARRNALAASTALIRRRREQDDAEQFLRTLNQTPPSRTAAGKT